MELRVREVAKLFAVDRKSLLINAELTVRFSLHREASR
jgi:hypothetical protein